jgi:hypothetical protein
MNTTHKKYGYVPINIEVVKAIRCTELDESGFSLLAFQQIYSTRTFQIIESSAYFESYVHVLRSL